MAGLRVLSWLLPAWSWATSLNLSAFRDIEQATRSQQDSSEDFVELWEAYESECDDELLGHEDLEGLEFFGRSKFGQELRVDSAWYMPADDANEDMAEDVTEAVNNLISRHGVADITGHRILQATFGERDHPMILRITAGGISADIGERKTKPEVDGRQLMRKRVDLRLFFGKPLRVDEAIYYTNAEQKDVSKTINLLILENGVGDIAGGTDMTSALGFILNGTDRVLNVSRGSRNIVFHEEHHGNHVEQLYDLRPLFDEEDLKADATFSAVKGGAGMEEGVAAQDDEGARSEGPVRGRPAPVAFYASRPTATASLSGDSDAIAKKVAWESQELAQNLDQDFREWQILAGGAAHAVQEAPDMSTINFKEAKIQDEDLLELSRNLNPIGQADSANGFNVRLQDDTGATTSIQADIVDGVNVSLQDDTGATTSIEADIVDGVNVSLQDDTGATTSIEAEIHLSYDPGMAVIEEQDSAKDRVSVPHVPAPPDNSNADSTTKPVSPLTTPPNTSYAEPENPDLHQHEVADAAAVKAMEAAILQQWQRRTSTFGNNVVLDFAEVVVANNSDRTVNVTEAANLLLQAHGAADLTGAKTLVQVFGDAAPGQAKYLHVGAGLVDMSIKDSLDDGTPAHIFDLRALFGTPFKVDAATFKDDAHAEEDVLAKVNALIGAHGIGNITAGMPLAEALSFPKGNGNAVLNVSFGTDLLILRGNEADSVYNLRPLFPGRHSADSTFFGRTSVSAYGRTRSVDEAFIIGVVTGETTDVTTRVNRLLSAFGLADITAGRRLSTVFAAPHSSERSDLYVRVGNTSMKLHSHASNGKPNRRFDLRPLFGQCLRVDVATYGSDPSTLSDVTFLINRLIADNGIGNVTGGHRISDVFKRTAEEHVSTGELRVRRGSRWMRFTSQDSGGHSVTRLDLRKLFVVPLPQNATMQPCDTGLCDSSVYDYCEKAIDYPASRNTLAARSHDGNDLKVDSVVYGILGDAKQSKDVTAVFNELIAKNGVADVLDHGHPNAIFGDPAPGRVKRLQITHAGAVHVLFEAMLGDVDVRHFFGTPLEVDLAVYITDHGGVRKEVNITKHINALIAANGVGDITAKAPLRVFVGELNATCSKMLQVSKGKQRSTYYQLDNPDIAIDLRRILGHELPANATFVRSAAGAAAPQPATHAAPTPQAVPQPAANAAPAPQVQRSPDVAATSAVDRAVLRSNSSFGGPFTDVTLTVNMLIARNGLNNFTQHANFMDVLQGADPEPGQPKVLRLSVGPRWLDIRETDAADLQPLFGAPLRVDSALYWRSGHSASESLNVTDAINGVLSQAARSNGLRELSLKRSATKFSDPDVIGEVSLGVNSPGNTETLGSEQVLRLRRGSLTLDLPEKELRGADGSQVLRRSALHPLFADLDPATFVLRGAASKMPSIFIMVNSIRSQREQRDVARETWALDRSSGRVHVAFGVCSDVNDSLADTLQAEQRAHQDLILLDCEEGTDEGRLTFKVVRAMKHFKSSTTSKLFMKVDVSTFVAWSRLSEFLARSATAWSYIGVPIEDLTPCRNESVPWYEPLNVFNESKYPTSMAGGSGFVMGRALVEKILDEGIAERNMLYNHDRAVGVWVDRAINLFDAPVEYISIPGIDGEWQWDSRHPTKNWLTWADYPHMVHHGLSSQTVHCLTQVDQDGDPWRELESCFIYEEGVDRPHSIMSCQM